MKRKILVKGAGILYSEIILTALQEYRQQCRAYWNHCRADVVQDIIDALIFDGDEKE